MTWRDSQEQFAAAVRTSNAEVPTGIKRTRSGDPSSRRFSVYRNNHVSSLIDVLGSRFSTVRESVGDDFFREMTRPYIEAEPPASPVLLRYGATFPDHIRAFEPAGELPFLGDLAALEFLIGESYHSADAEPLAVTALATVPPEQTGAVRFTLHPSLRLFASDWPVFSIWAAHRTDDPASALEGLVPEPQMGLVVRPVLDVDVQALTGDAYRFISCLKDGGTLDEAIAKLDHTTGEDVSGLLQHVFASGVVTGLRLT